MILALLLAACVSWSDAEVAAHRADRACRIACAGDAAEVRRGRCWCETVGGIEWRP